MTIVSWEIGPWCNLSSNDVFDTYIPTLNDIFVTQNEALGGDNDFEYFKEWDN